MKGTNYYVIHKATGRKIKVTLLGFMHTVQQRQSMLDAIAKIERHRADQYKVKLEIEHDAEVRDMMKHYVPLCVDSQAARLAYCCAPVHGVVVGGRIWCHEDQAATIHQRAIDRFSPTIGKVLL